MCESPSITALRRASREYPQLVSLASRAFVSFIRAYKEHECRYIFQLKRLDITSLVHSFALFKVPNCGEIRKMSIIRIPIQEEFNDILDKLKEQRKIKKESEDQQRKEAEQAAADGDDRLLKKHRTDRNEALDRLKHDTTLTRGAKANLWRRAEIDEIMKESYYIKKEKMGKISSKFNGLHLWD